MADEASKLNMANVGKGREEEVQHVTKMADEASKVNMANGGKGGEEEDQLPVDQPAAGASISVEVGAAEDSGGSSAGDGVPENPTGDENGNQPAEVESSSEENGLKTDDDQASGSSTSIKDEVSEAFGGPSAGAGVPGNQTADENEDDEIQVIKIVLRSSRHLYAGPSPGTRREFVSRVRARDLYSRRPNANEPAAPARPSWHTPSVWGTNEPLEPVGDGQAAEADVPAVPAVEEGEGNRENGNVSR